MQLSPVEAEVKEEPAKAEPVDLILSRPTKA
jgi:hypothetical protein